MASTSLPPSGAAAGTVFIVERDAAVRASLVELVEAAGLTANAFGTGTAFLAEYRPTVPQCLVLAGALADMSGGDVLDRLLVAHPAPLTFMVVTHADIDAILRAMVTRTITTILQPVDGPDLLNHIRLVLDVDARWQHEPTQGAHEVAGFARLTPRERQLLALTWANRTAAEIGSQMELSEAAVWDEQYRILQKLGWLDADDR